ncbi:hypothetical protein DFS33DRAFT_1277642 [Desarmillaria ectypa]|nr:hypothetical protein DFS33DRAFT_1277642 [Desarmillaria ectypa]
MREDGTQSPENSDAENIQLLGSRATMKKTYEASQVPELYELEYLQRLRLQNPGHVGYPYVVHLTDSFNIDGPHGKHLCVKSFAGYRIPEYGAKRVIRDVLSAQDYVHNDCNIIHTDVKITNVVMTVPQEAMPKEGLGTLIPAQQHTIPVSTDNDAPVTITVWVPLSFKLIDFGVACMLRCTRKLVTPTEPENTLPKVFVPSVYVPQRWLYVLAELYGMLVGRPLFPVQCDPVFLPAYQVQVLGEFPTSLRE